MGIKGFGFALTLTTAACSGVNQGSAGAPPVSDLTISSADLFAELSAPSYKLPSGVTVPRSTMMAQLGQMSLQELTSALKQTPGQGRLTIDGVTLPALGGSDQARRQLALLSQQFPNLQALASAAGIDLGKPVQAQIVGALRELAASQHQLGLMNEPYHLDPEPETASPEAASPGAPTPEQVAAYNKCVQDRNTAVQKQTTAAHKMTAVQDTATAVGGLAGTAYSLAACALGWELRWGSLAVKHCTLAAVAIAGTAGYTIINGVKTYNSPAPTPEPVLPPISNEGLCGNVSPADYYAAQYINAMVEEKKGATSPASD